MSAPQQQTSPAVHRRDIPAQRSGAVATRIRLDHVHPCATCGAPRRLILQNTPDSSRLGVSEWRVVRADCSGSCCVGPDKACPPEAC